MKLTRARKIILIVALLMVVVSCVFQPRAYKSGAFVGWWPQGNAEGYPLAFGILALEWLGIVASSPLKKAGF